MECASRGDDDDGDDDDDDDDDIGGRRWIKPNVVNCSFER
jgi:hypothetical protein